MVIKSKNKKLIIGIIVLIIIIIAIFFISKQKKAVITFELDEINYMSVRYGEKLKEPAKPSKDGYTFLGWYNGDEKFDFDTKIEEDIVLTPKWEANEYKITFNTGEENISATAKYGSTIELPEAPKRIGYIFVGWYNNDEEFTEESIVEKDLELEARWANNYATYRVEHYLMNKDKTYSEEPNYIESQNIIVGKTIEPDTNTYTGYISPEKQSLVITDGENVIRYYYELQEYTLKLQTDAGFTDVTGAGTYFYGDKINIGYNLKPGYSFKNYNVKTNGDVYTMTDSDIVIKLTSTPNKNTKYKVKHLLMQLDGTTYIAKDVETLTGTTDTKVTPQVKNYVGFTSPSEVTVNVDGDGNRVVNYLYKRNKYNLTLTSSEGIKSLSGEGTYYYGEYVTIEATLDDGYEFAGWSTGKKTLASHYEMPAEPVTITASADIINYNIIYIPNGGTLSGEYSSTYNVQNETITLASIIKPGFVFNGWYTDKETQNKFEYQQGMLGDITLYAGWDANKFAVHFYTNGGSEVDDLQLDCDEPIDLDGYQEPTKNGYTFAGWYTDQALTKEFVNETHMPVGGMTLYAKWNKVTYQINYKLNDGIVSGNPTEYTIEDTYNLVSPEKVGYTFSHWIITGDELPDDIAGKKLPNNQIPTGLYGDITLEAIYTLIDYKLTYVLDSATAEHVSNFDKENLPTTYTILGGETLVAPTIEGYTFSKWVINGKDYTDSTTKMSSNITENQTIEIVYTLNKYNLSYKLDNTTSQHISNFDQTNLPKEYTVLGGEELVAPEIKGYTFSKWVINETDYTDSTTKMPSDITEDQTIEIVYTLNKYNLSYKLDNTTSQHISNFDQTNLPKEYTVLGGEELVAPEIEGYTFSKWIIDGQDYEGSTTNMPSNLVGDQTIEIVYTLNSYNLSYKLDNATSQNISDFDQTKLPKEYTVLGGEELVAPEIKGYTFNKWLINGKEYNTNSMNMPSGIVENQTIEIVYTVNNYKLNYKLDDDTSKFVESFNQNNLPETYTIVGGEELTAPEIEGYTFSKWIINGKDYTDSTTKMPSDITEEQTIEIIYKPITYTVVYNGNGNTNLVDRTTDTIIYNSSDEQLQNNLFTRKYNVTYNYILNAPQDLTDEVTYKFVGWSYVDDDGNEQKLYLDNLKYPLNLTKVPGKEIELKAIWEADKTITLRTVASAGGYIFSGWQYSNDLTGDSVTTAQITNDTSFTAKWQYDVTVNGNGGTTSDGKTETTIRFTYDAANYGLKNELSTNLFTKEIKLTYYKDNMDNQVASSNYNLTLDKYVTDDNSEFDGTKNLISKDGKFNLKAEWQSAVINSLHSLEFGIVRKEKYDNWFDCGVKATAPYSISEDTNLIAKKKILVNFDYLNELFPTSSNDFYGIKLSTNKKEFYIRDLNRTFKDEATNIETIASNLHQLLISGSISSIEAKVNGQTFKLQTSDIQKQCQKDCTDYSSSRDFINNILNTLVTDYQTKKLADLISKNIQISVTTNSDGVTTDTANKIEYSISFAQYKELKAETLISSLTKKDGTGCLYAFQVNYEYKKIHIDATSTNHTVYLEYGSDSNTFMTLNGSGAKSSVQRLVNNSYVEYITINMEGIDPVNVYKKDVVSDDAIASSFSGLLGGIAKAVTGRSWASEWDLFSVNNSQLDKLDITVTIHPAPEYKFEDGFNPTYHIKFKLYTGDWSN